MKKPISISIFCTLLFLPIIVFGQQYYEPLVDLGLKSDDFGGYINLLYVTSISIASLLAVIKIIIAGLKYMLSDVVTTKGDALKDIRTSLLGLILIISAVLVLNVINPNLTKLDINIKPLLIETGDFDPLANIDGGNGTSNIGGNEDKVPAKTAYPIETYGRLVPKYTSTDGVTHQTISKIGTDVYFDPTGLCTDENRPNIYPSRNDCLSSTRDALKDYCIHNGAKGVEKKGDVFDTNDSRYTCQLPTKVSDYGAIETIHNSKYPSIEYDTDRYEVVCGEEGGIWVDTNKGVFNSNEYKCVWY